MLIKELSLKTGASVRSIRYYETKKLINSSRLENGYRDYETTAVKRIKTIQFYLGLGLSTQEIASIIQCPTIDNHRPLCQGAYQLYQAKLEEINKQIEILQDLKLKLEERINEGGILS